MMQVRWHPILSQVVRISTPLTNACNCWLDRDCFMNKLILSLMIAAFTLSSFLSEAQPLPKTRSTWMQPRFVKVKKHRKRHHKRHHRRRHCRHFHRPRPVGVGPSPMLHPSRLPR